MKCPACGFETVQEQGWCDFCKEPFRTEDKPKPAQGPAKVKVPPEVLFKLKEQRAAVTGEKDPKADIPPEFAGLDTGGQIQGFSPMARRLAWVFLVVCMAWAVVMGLLLIFRARKIAQASITYVGLETAKLGSIRSRFSSVTVPNLVSYWYGRQKAIRQ